MTKKQAASILFLPAAGIALLWFASAPYRAGVSPDTVAFLNVAHHLQAGQGISAYYPLYSDHSSPLAAWPPLFPFIIWSGMPFGVHPLDTAWLVNLLLFGVNLWLLGRIAFNACRSVRAGIAAQVIFLLVPMWRKYFIWGVSEPVFLCLVHLAVLWTLRYLESGRERHLVGAALALGLSEWARYIGGVYVPIFAAGIFLYQNGPFKTRLKNSVRFAVMAGALPVVWAIRNFVRLQHVPLDTYSWADRVFGSLMHHEEGPYTLWQNAVSAFEQSALWVSHFCLDRPPKLFTPWIVAAFAAAVVGAVVAGVVKRTDRPAVGAAFCGFLAGGYWLGLVGALTFSRFVGGMPDRYLLPAVTHVILMTLILVCANARKLFGWVVAAGFAAWVLMMAADLPGWIHLKRAEGVDSSLGQRWRRAEEHNWFPTPELIQDYRNRKLYEDQSSGRSF